MLSKIGFLFFGFVFASSVLAASNFEKDVQPLLEKYCYSCHGPETQDGGIEFHEIRTTEDAFRFHKLLGNAAKQIHRGDMPPLEADDFPTETEEDVLQEALQDLSDLVEEGKVPPNAGRTTIRRLNRNEYNYTVRDLFGIDFQPARNFPVMPQQEKDSTTLPIPFSCRQLF